MVAIFLPTTSASATEQERIATPSTWTVQAPHWAMPQPYLVPVMPSVSRSTHNRGVSASTSTLWVWPLMVRVGILVLQFPRPQRANEGASSGAWVIGPHAGREHSLFSFQGECAEGEDFLVRGGHGGSCQSRRFPTRHLRGGAASAWVISLRCREKAGN